MSIEVPIQGRAGAPFFLGGQFNSYTTNNALAFLIIYGSGAAQGAEMKIALDTAVRITSIQVQAVANTKDGASSVTVFKNGVATAVTISVPAGSTTRVKSSGLTADFAAGDTIGINMDTTASTLGAWTASVIVQGYRLVA